MLSPRFVEDPHFGLESLKRYINYQEEDASLLSDAVQEIEKSLDDIISYFYKQIINNDIARNILKQSGTAIDELKKTQRAWVVNQLIDPLDEEFYLQQKKIGSRHVEVNLPHSFMVLGIDILKSSICKVLFDFYKDDSEKMHRSSVYLNKKLDISLAIMLKSYQDARDEIHKEKVLIENENILTLGRMSASIAHEVKNPLAGINGAVQVLRDKLPKDHDDLTVMDAILEQIKRLTGTVNDLLEFSRPVKLNLQDIALKDIIESLDPLLKSDPNFNLQLMYKDKETETLVFNVDPLRIQNIFYNIFINANDAVADHGMITLSSESDKNTSTIFIQDNGPGIPHDWIPHLFKPFSTNKANGTGLGLAICKKIMDAHNGNISYVNKEKGACFKLELPKRTNK